MYEGGDHGLGRVFPGGSVLLPSCGRLLLAIPMQVLQQLDQAITLACSPSPEVGQLARSVALCCSEEQAAAARLRDAVNGRGLPARTLDAAAVLAEAIEGATAFPRLVGGCQGPCIGAAG